MRKDFVLKDVSPKERNSLQNSDKSSLKRAKRKIRKGIVVSNKNNKTVVVEIQRTFKHPFYGKIVRMTNNLKAHDEKNECAIGDLVEIMETRPISRDKRWRLVKILGKVKVRVHDLPKGKREKPAAEEKKSEGGAQT
jgi:small subunit ribosomal protein S17